jgi:hypothetical protein
MITVNWPSNTQTRDVVNAIRRVIGRPVVFQVPYSTECTYSGCYLDPITGNSTDSFCPVCSGTHFINTYSGVTISGHVTWAMEGNDHPYAPGIQIDGDVRIQIELTDANITVCDSAKWLEVDGKKVEIHKRILRGFQELNRVLLDCKELEEDT